MKEAIWIRKTEINQDEGNYELPHAYVAGMGQLNWKVN